MIRALIKTILFIASICLFFPFIWLLDILGLITTRDKVINVFHHAIRSIVGLTVMSSTQLSSSRPLMAVSNHIGYLDIIATASQFPYRFTPKSDIARWPIVGWACRMSNCIFIERKASKVKKTSEELKATLDRGDVIILFPEATTNNGRYVIPFKSGFFNLAHELPNLQVQPIAMSYTHINGKPIDDDGWDRIAWYGDGTLLPHVWDFFKLRSIKMEVHHLEPVTLAQFADRKALAQHCHAAIAQKLGLEGKTGA